MFLDQRERFHPVPAFGHDANIRMRPEEKVEFFAGQRLVIDDNGADQRFGHGQIGFAGFLHVLVQGPPKV